MGFSNDEYNTIIAICSMVINNAQKQFNNNKQFFHKLLTE